MLATFNGAAFLPAQLESLQAQSYENWLLLTRDDGSADATRDVLADFASQVGGDRVRDVAGPHQRIGSLRSFLTLLAAAPAGRRYAFSDQDDVWLPGKLERATRMLDREPQDRPLLYCARQKVVDADLRPLHLSPLAPRGPSFGNALVQNIVTGCTVVMNDMARQAVLAVSPPDGSHHDWWSYLSVSGVGGQVIFDPEPVMLYRQHGANVVGAATALTRARRALWRGPRRFLELLLAQARTLSGHPNLTPEAQQLSQLVLALPTMSPAQRSASLRRSGIQRQRLAENLLLHFWTTVGFRE